MVEIRQWASEIVRNGKTGSKNVVKSKVPGVISGKSGVKMSGGNTFPQPISDQNLQ